MDRVLVIDDDRFMQNAIKKYLYKEYDVRTADDGDAGKLLANTWAPNVILLDVEMPGRNGYEVCDELKRSESTQNIPVIFLSGKSSVRERLLGFEVGGDDYLVKPCSQALLNAKIHKITEFYKHKQSLTENVQSAEKTAVEAMSTSFELGKAVRFVERSFGIGDVGKLGSVLMDVMQDLQLKSCCMFVCRDGLKFFSSTVNDVAPMEQEILEKLHTDQRFTDFGCRTQVNYPQVALLVKNMPLDDRSRYGRIKDILPFLLGTTDAKLKVLDAEVALKTQNENMSKFVERLQSTMDTVESKLNDNRNQASSIMLGLTTELSLELGKLGLDGDQEDYIQEKVNGAAERMLSLLDEGGNVQDALNKTISLLKSVVKEQNKIITESLATENIKDDSSISSDIELF